MDLTRRVARDVVRRPLERQGFDRQSTMGRWTVVMNHYAVTGRRVPQVTVDADPVAALAAVIRSEYGLDDEAARVRGMQIVAFALGWRIFEDLLLRWGAVDGLPKEHLRSELNRLHRRIGATPWPSPPDPPTVNDADGQA